MLRGLYPVLTESEKRVADRILEDPSLCLHSSIAVVAERCGVGVSTISRLSAKLGYESFPDMKLALAIDLLNPDRGAVEPVNESDDAKTVASKVLRAAARNFEDTADLLDPVAVEQAANAILNAHRIEIYAVGILMGSIAHHAEGRLRLLQIPCSAVTEQWEHGVCAALLGAGDVAIGLSYSGDTEAIADALRVAGANGAATIAITKAQRSLVAEAAQHRLYVAAQEEGRWGDFVTSRMSMLGVIESLYALALLMHSRTRPGETNSPNAAPA
jgi:DNA-binding MurR/RpiR family transcriptional regulator